MSIRASIVAVLLAGALPNCWRKRRQRAGHNGYQESDYVVSNYKFVSGENLPQVKMRVTARSVAKRNAAGNVVNAVLLLQGNTGTSANWFRPSLADELFKRGQPLDATENTTSSCPTHWAAVRRNRRMD